MSVMTTDPMQTTTGPEHPFDRVVALLRAHGCTSARGCRLTHDRLRAKCPTHSDARPSLVVTRRDDKVLIRCFAGCRTSDVVRAIGLKMADLFGGRVSPIAAKPEIVATYDYIDLAGVLLAQKVRYAHKAFRWRAPDPSRPIGWRWDLRGAVPGLYRLPDLIDAHQVFVNEGENATDLLWDIGLPATCPPTGASTWKSSWRDDLLTVGCQELFVLADNDRAGEQHALRVAADVHADMRVKVIRLPGLQSGADAFDWIEGGQTPSDLADVVSRAAWWTPEAEATARLERRRTLTRERVRRHRAQPDLAVACNAANVIRIDVTRNAVTQCERSSKYVTKTCTGNDHFGRDVHSVTGTETRRPL
jgi:hypothetical protein